MAAPSRIEIFTARRTGKEPLELIFDEALRGWRRNHPNDAPTHTFASAGLALEDQKLLAVYAYEVETVVELRRDVGPYDIAVGVHLAPAPAAVEGQGDSDA